MKLLTIFIFAAMAWIASAAVAQSSTTATDELSFVGTWKGEMNGLPGVDLRIEGAGKNLTGVIVFYFQERSDASGPWHLAGEYRTALLVPHVAGKVLTFEAEHHTCHGCAELGPNVKFLVELTGPKEARMWNLNEESGPGLKLVRAR